MVLHLFPHVLQIEAIQFPFALVKGTFVGTCLVTTTKRVVIACQTAALQGTGSLGVVKANDQAFQESAWRRKREIKDWTENTNLPNT